MSKFTEYEDTFIENSKLTADDYAYYHIVRGEETTCDRLDSILEENGRVNKLRKVLAALMHRRMNENDIEHIKKWVMAYDTDEELLRYAFRVNDYKGEIKTTDVENEVNGLMTYDRKVLKYDADALRKAHQAIISAAEGR